MFFKHIHTDYEIQQAAEKLLKDSDEHLVCVIFSNAETKRERRVSIFDGYKRVYSCDLPLDMASIDNRMLISLVSSYDATSNRRAIDLT